jgi:hypothetical protein
MKYWREQMKPCPEKWLDNPEGKQAVTEHQEVPNEWAAAEVIGAV